MRCPKCKTLWEVDTQNAIAVELFDECLTCRRDRLVFDDLQKVVTEQKARRDKNMGGSNGRIN